MSATTEGGGEPIPPVAPSRATIRSDAARRRESLLSAPPPRTSISAEFRRLTDEFEFGVIWGRDRHLREGDQAVVTATCLMAGGHMRRLEAMLSGLIGEGLTPTNLIELANHVSLYVGVPASEEVFDVLERGFSGLGIVAEDAGVGPDRYEDLDELAQRARLVVEQLHGDRGLRGHADPAAPFTAELYRLTLMFGYGTIWRRPGLTLDQRIVASLASFATLGHIDGFFDKFASTAHDHGMSIERLVDIVCHASPYTGHPRALLALQAVGRLASSVNQDVVGSPHQR